MSLAPLVLHPSEGRRYYMPGMMATFMADGVETAGRYSVSQWRVRPRSTGPGQHRHESEDELFYVTEGTMSVLVGGDWHDLEAGSFIRIPAGTLHDFENRTDTPATMLNVFMGAFEHNMPAIVEWYAQNR